jgi:hypothetical protein
VTEQATAARWDVSPADIGPKPVQRKAPEGMRTFTLYRRNSNGPSGVVLEGVIFSTGKTIVHWLTPAPQGSLNIFENFQHFRNIHVRGHDGMEAVVTFGDGEQIRI